MKKRIMLVFMALLLAFPLPIGMADPNEDIDDLTSEEEPAEEEESDTGINGNVASKDEVIYGRLSASGRLQDLYVVNMLEVKEFGTVIDYGTYTSVKNLTDLTEIERTNNTVQLEASPGWFYYQGNMENGELPWYIDISYMLDGEEISPHDLAGKEGRLLISINTSQNERVNPAFYEYYTLQISLKLDTDIISNIQAPDATIANAGKQRQVSFTVMPDRDGELSLLADVVNFEMAGIEIAGIPLSMMLDDFETDEMTKELRKLRDAIQEINKGVYELLTGVVELNDGVHQLSDGSTEFNKGMREISNSSSELVEASASIDEALSLISDELSNASFDLEVDDISDLLEGFLQFAAFMEEMVRELDNFNENFTEAYSQLEEALNSIPEPPDTFKEDIEKLYETGVARETLDHLLEVHDAAQEARKALDAMNEAMENIDIIIDDSNSSVDNINEQLLEILEAMSSGMELLEDLSAFGELIDGINMLSANYSEFHTGLVAYTDGVSQLAGAYGEIDSGIKELADGTSELESGVGELYDGTNQLAKETSELPEQLQKEIDAIMDEFDFSDFEPVSFVSEENSKIGTVQFVLRTEAIERHDDDDNDEEEEESPSFWERLRNLFS